jgi:antitoxin MazE
MKSKNAKWEYLIAEMRRLGPENEPEMVDWGPDVGAEIIDDDAYSRGEITLDDLLSKKSRPPEQSPSPQKR